MKPIASLSLDLDNKWAYMRAHGVEGWKDYPSYFDAVVPRILNLCSQRGLHLTAFVVGRDAEDPRNVSWLQQLAGAGHEFGNHSYLHEPWLHRYTIDQLKDDLDRSEAAIDAALGVRPKGFRGPGFSISATLLDELIRRGYEYDASTFPTFIGPLARAAYFKSARLSKEDREARAAQFGTFRDGLQPLKPYLWRLESGTLLEVPVTTMPVLKTPIHFTYLHYLAAKSPALANLYFRAALRLCRVFGTQPSILLHPLDFLSAEDVPELKDFPGIGRSTSRKLSVLNDLFDTLQDAFDLLSIGQFVREHARTRTPRIRDLHA